MSETNSNNPQAKDNILKIKYQLRKNGVTIYPPDINKSYPTYRLIENDKLLTGLSALHGVKENPAQEILNKRPYSSFEDLLLRTDASIVRAPVIQALAACGALDCFGLSRNAEVRKLIGK